MVVCRDHGRSAGAPGAAGPFTAGRSACLARHWILELAARRAGPRRRRLGPGAVRRSRRRRARTIAGRPRGSPSRTSNSPSPPRARSPPSGVRGCSSSPPRSPPPRASATGRSIPNEPTLAPGHRPTLGGNGTAAAGQRSGRPELQRVPHHRQQRHPPAHPGFRRGRRPGAERHHHAHHDRRLRLPRRPGAARARARPRHADAVRRRRRLQRPARQPAVPVRRRRRRAAGQGDDRGPPGAARRGARRSRRHRHPARHPRRPLRDHHHRRRRRQRRAPPRGHRPARLPGPAAGGGPGGAAVRAQGRELLDARLRPRRDAVPLRHPAGRGGRRGRGRRRRRGARRGDRRRDDRAPHLRRHQPAAADGAARPGRARRAGHLPPDRLCRLPPRAVGDPLPTAAAGLPGGRRAPARPASTRGSTWRGSASTGCRAATA